MTVVPIGRAANLEIGRLADSYPIRVRVGDRVRANQVKFRYWGPAGTIYLCWGLRKGSGDFNNGDNLAGGARAIGSAAVSVGAGTELLVNTAIAADLVIPSTRAGNYATYIWLSTESSARESAFVRRHGSSDGLITIDGSVTSGYPIAVVEEAPVLPGATELEISYVGLS